ncbi:MAG: hypothetical protein P8Z75_01190 [Gammaproteobacteria bacterium]|jgi:hypothetical protein
MSNEINAQLRQLGCYGQIREYQIVNGKNIRIAIGSKSRNKVFSVPMLALAEKSKIRLQIAWAWFWLALIGLLAIPVYLLVKSQLDLKAQIVDFAILGVLVVAVLIGLFMLFMNFARKRVYYTAYSRVPLFDILIGKPDNRSFKAFHEAFETYRQKTRSFWDLKPEQQIAGEIRMLRRLAAEGVIPQKVYEDAKDKLFSMSHNTSASAA